jgi:hypothetical protein
MRNYILAVLLSTLAVPVVADDDWEILRTYISHMSPRIARTVIVTQRFVWIRCATIDYDYKHITVGIPQYVLPPTGEVMVMGAKNAIGVECWEWQR